MHAVSRIPCLGALALAAAACGGVDAEQQQAANNSALVGDIEALPPDESAATPTDELANGDAEPQGNTADVEP